MELSTYSLVTHDGKTLAFTVHRLVQDVTRRSLMNGMDNELLPKTLGEALRWIHAAWREMPRTFALGRSLILCPPPHVLLRYADAADIPDPTVQLMNELARLLFTKSLFGEAEPLMRRALAMNESSLGRVTK